VSLLAVALVAQLGLTQPPATPAPGRWQIVTAGREHFLLDTATGCSWLRVAGSADAWQPMQRIEDARGPCSVTAAQWRERPQRVGAETVRR
jgi:hypothetical protein